MVSLLINSGADVNKEDQHGSTALMTASEEGSDIYVQMLLDKKPM